jgi:hypothetical protein
MSKVKIIFEQSVDQLSISNDLAIDGSFPIDINNNYALDLPTQVVLNVLPTDSVLIEALLKVLDAASFQYMSTSIFYIIIQNTKSFDFSQSYVRDIVSTGRPLTALADGQEIIARFQIASFSGTQFREIVLYYNDALNPLELEALEEIGIVLTGNGSSFSITNTFETKVSFSKPVGVLETYAIDFNNADQIMQPS